MAFEFTPGLTRALTRAMAFAQLEHEDAVHTGHLFQGLVEEDEASPFLMLLEAGVDKNALAAHFLPRVPGKETVSLPLDSSIRDVLGQAQAVARSATGQATVASDHVLLALLDHDDRLREQLQQMGLAYDRIRQRVQPEIPPIRMEEPLELLETTDCMDVARILDASANRAREAMRVLEDHCRFLLNDALLSGQLKSLRHEFADAIALLPADILLASRDTLHDVGTNVATQQEMVRTGVRDVLAANFCRLQEALRSLEEYGKILQPSFGQLLEQLRYRTYTIERTLIVGTSAREQLARARLYVLVTEKNCRLSLFGTVAEILAGGAQVIQLREKEIPDRTLLKQAREIRKMTRDAGALFIINDRPDIARLSEADGVHLGQEDMPVQEARRILGPTGLIGVSTHDMSQVEASLLQGASYIGVGPTFPSDTKKFDAFPGLDFVRAVVANTTLPAFALGGINADNAPAVFQAGAIRIAVSQAICAADEPRKAARQLRLMLDDHESCSSGHN